MSWSCEARILHSVIPTEGRCEGSFDLVICRQACQVSSSMTGHVKVTLCSQVIFLLACRRAASAEKVCQAVVQCWLWNTEPKAGMISSLADMCAGAGLGAKGQGIAAPVQPITLDGGTGLGFQPPPPIPDRGLPNLRRRRSPPPLRRCAQQHKCCLRLVGM